MSSRKKNESGKQQPNPEIEKLKMQQQIERRKAAGAEGEGSERDPDQDRRAGAEGQAAQRRDGERSSQIKMIEMRAKTDDDQIRAQAQNQKMMGDREKLQMDMIKKQTDVQVAQEKARLAGEQMQMRRRRHAGQAAGAAEACAVQAAGYGCKAGDAQWPAIGSVIWRRWTPMMCRSNSRLASAGPIGCSRRERPV